MIQYYKNITSSEGTKVWFTQSIKNGGKLTNSQKESLEPIKRGMKGKELQPVRLLHKESLILYRRVHYASAKCSGIWTCQFMGCSKATQRVRKMKASDVCKKPYVYKIIVKWFRQAWVQQKVNIESVLNQQESNLGD